jgi:predicted MFS family arabinose efflux permease
VSYPRLQVATLCLGNAIGFNGPAVMPLWVANLMHGDLLPPNRVGWLASGELLLIALGSLSVSAIGRHARPRSIGLIAAIIIVAANAVAGVPHVHTLIAGRLASGLAMGALLGVVNGVAARRHDAHRVLALMQASMITLLSVIFLSGPTLVSHFGLRGLFAGFIIIGSLVAVFSWFSLPSSAASRRTAELVTQSTWWVPLIGCLGLSAALISQNTVWTSIIAIGGDRGFDPHAMGVLLAICCPLCLLGPVGARVLGERFGLMRPLLSGMTVILVDLLLIPHTRSIFIFGVYTTVLNSLILFCVPYAIALLSRLDPTGRFASAAPAFMMTGAAVGPALGSHLALAGRYDLLTSFAAGIALISIVLFVSAQALQVRLKTPVSGLRFHHDKPL